MRRPIALIGLLALAACQNADEPNLSTAQPDPVAPSPLAVAWFSGGEVTAEELNDYIIRLDPAERPSPGGRLDAWHRELTRRIVIDRLLLEEARAESLQTSDAFLLRRAAIERQLAVQSCQRRLVPASETISEQELQAAYDARIDQLKAPERRSVYHLYLRAQPGEAPDALQTRAEALRLRVLQGESFQALAREHSDSESRHYQGALGWIVPGQLPEALDAVVFSLDEGVPSLPVLADSGAHLFQVDDVLPERQVPLRDVAAELGNVIAAEKVEAALEQIAALNEQPEARIVDRAELDRMVEQGEEDGVVLTTSDHALTLHDFRLRLGRVLGEPATVRTARASRIRNDMAWDLLVRLHRHELAYEHCVRNDQIDTASVERSLEAWEDQALVNQMRQRRLLEQVAAQPEQLDVFYQSNLGQFTPPVQWNLDRLRIPYETAGQGETLMSRAEQIVGDLTGELEAVQQALGGSIESLGWRSLEQVRQLNFKSPQHIAAATNGSLIPPLHFDDAIEVYRVNDRRQPEAPPLDAVRDEVMAAYLRQYTQEVYAALESAMLEQAGFQLDEERLAALRTDILPEDEITVEQLEALLEGS